MGLPEDLLLQAEHLAYLDKRRPQQANLRRAISSAYYAFFHMLIEESSGMLISGGGFYELRTLVRRAYVHGEMKAACSVFADPTRLPKHLKKVLQQVPAALQEVAQAFTDSQEARHRADYDVAAKFSRAETLKHIRNVQRAFCDWQSVRATPEARVFLAALLLAKRWNR